MIDFNIPPLVGDEIDYIRQAINSHKICGDGPFTKKCSKWMEDRFHSQKVLLTTSGTSALEMAALLCDFHPGDEVILPSYTFSSTATAFVLAGAKLVFVDIRPDTMNIDENKIINAINKHTKAICVMHYAGVACEMDKIMSIAKEYNLYVIEDAAQGVMSKYKGKALGTIGDFGCFSFHETKNYSMGEGGALLISDEKFNEMAEILREKGTDRSRFLRGQVDKYTWKDYGSSYLPSELNAAYLWGQLEKADLINDSRIEAWNTYYELLSDLSDKGFIELPTIPKGCIHNAHMFYIKVKDIHQRTEIQKYLRDKNIYTAFHYIPLHSAPAGIKFGRFNEDDEYTTIESEKLFRLPMYFGLTSKECKIVSKYIHSYFEIQNNEFI